MDERVSTENLVEPDLEDLSRDDLNQVEIRTVSGAVHRVEYVLRHPDKDWLYAKRVTEYTDEVLWNDMVLFADNVESIESNTVTPASRGEKTERNRRTNDTLVYHSGEFNNVEISDAWKAWKSDNSDR